MARNFNVIQALDKWAVFFYIVLVVFGWLNIYGASVSEDQTSILDMNYRSGMQFVWMGISFGMALVILFTDSRLITAVPYLLYGLIVLLLIVTVFVAEDIKGSRSWLPLGPFKFQPAEFSKFITALALAKVMGHPQFRLKSLQSYAIVASMILLPMLIIVAQSETGSALVFLSFVFMLYREGLPGLIPALGFCAIVLFVVVLRFSVIDLFGVEGSSMGLFLGLLLAYIIMLIFLRVYQYDKKHLLVLSLAPIGIFALTLPIFKLVVRFNFVYVMIAIVVLAAVYMLVLAYLKWRRTYLFIGLFLLGSLGYCFSIEYIFDEVLQSHQQKRIHLLLGMADDPTGIGYNTNQARIAIGSGGFWGKGFLQGTQTKLKYVPEQDTDFIFCTVGEEWGFVGSVGMLLVYLLFLYRLITIAERQDTRFARVYGYGVVGIFAIHLFINVGMVLGLVPVIGIPLPFFSYGGSSFLSFTILLFLFLKIDTMRIERVRN
jgi:rod shape determining protein RodA